MTIMWVIFSFSTPWSLENNRLVNAVAKWVIKHRDFGSRDICYTHFSTLQGALKKNNKWVTVKMGHCRPHLTALAVHVVASYFMLCVPQNNWPYSSSHLTLSLTVSIYLCYKIVKKKFVESVTYCTEIWKRSLELF